MSRTRQPDLFDHAGCSLSQWGGSARACRWCNDPLSPGRRRWCSALCLAEWRENHVWSKARAAALRRDQRRCVRCPTPLPRLLIPEVHHLRPCAGTRTLSCLHHLGNLQTLCDPCHRRAHREAA